MAQHFSDTFDFKFNPGGRGNQFGTTPNRGGGTLFDANQNQGFGDQFNQNPGGGFNQGGQNFGDGFNFNAFAEQQRNAFSSQQAQLGSSNVQSIIEQLSASGQLTPAALNLLNQQSQRQQAGGLEQFNASLGQLGLQESQFGRQLGLQERQLGQQESQFGRGLEQQESQFGRSQQNQLFDLLSGIDPEQRNQFLSFMRSLGFDFSGVGLDPLTREDIPLEDRLAPDLDPEFG